MATRHQASPVGSGNHRPLHCLTASINSWMLFKWDVPVCLYTILGLQLVFWKWTPNPSEWSCRKWYSLKKYILYLMGESSVYSLLLSVLVDFSPHTSKAQSKSWQFWATWRLQFIFTKPELMSCLLTGNICLKVQCSDPLKISMERVAQLKALEVKIVFTGIPTLFNSPKQRQSRTIISRGAECWWGIPALRRIPSVCPIRQNKFKCCGIEKVTKKIPKKGKSCVCSPPKSLWSPQLRTSQVNIFHKNPFIFLLNELFCHMLLWNY